MLESHYCKFFEERLVQHYHSTFWPTTKCTFQWSILCKRFRMQFTTMIQKRSQKEIRSVHSLSNFQLLRRRLLVSRGDGPPSERSIRSRKAVTWRVAGAGAGEEGWRLWPVNDFTAFSNFLSLTGMSKTGNTYSLFRLPSSFFSSDRCNNWIGFQNLF